MKSLEFAHLQKNIKTQVEEEVSIKFGSDFSNQSMEGLVNEMQRLTLAECSATEDQLEKP